MILIVLLIIVGLIIIVTLILVGLILIVTLIVAGLILIVTLKIVGLKLFLDTDSRRVDTDNTESKKHHHEDRFAGWWILDKENANKIKALENALYVLCYYVERRHQKHHQQMRDRELH